ncbi:2-polyprenyl-6-methoxyphenol hydroxylase-like FAD-dependent oxidoreductase [Streptomyces sp. SAI-144]|nr:2-polyprenyl-6-methoxyphenol hydroxylase-like FAD-dependent oxidoreductase [Streptomyces sp. SAI-144]
MPQPRRGGATGVALFGRAVHGTLPAVRSFLPCPYDRAGGGGTNGAGVARVLVIGGGIAGTAAALALHKAGFEAEVHEAHPDSAEDIGAFLTLASNGMRALAQLDASAVVTAVGFPLTSLRVMDDTGTEMAHAPMGAASDPLLRYRCLRRGDLNTALQAEAARRGITVRHGARLASVEDGPDGVTARFADGTAATGDLLIGADGLNSAVRQSISPGTRPFYAGQYVFYGYTRASSAPGADACITMVRGSGAAFGYAVSPDGETYWFARVTGDPLPAEELAQGTPAHWRDLLLPLLRKDTTPAAGLVAATGDDLMVTHATEIPTGTQWRSGRTLLIGDAAHAASPATGQGASMALEDAVVLAKSLRDAPDTDAALALYETLRRPRVEHNITVSGNISRGTPTPSAAARPSDEDLVRLLEWGGDLWAEHQVEKGQRFGI